VLKVTRVQEVGVIAMLACLLLSLSFDIAFFEYQGAFIVRKEKDVDWARLYC
jgi:hypothetical protein